MNQISTPQKNPPFPQHSKHQKIGRPRGSGKYGEPTTVVRIPISLADRLSELLVKQHLQSSANRHQLSTQQRQHTTLFPAFPSPLVPHLTPAKLSNPCNVSPCSKIDLNQHLLQHPNTTFLVRASGDSMIKAGIQANDILVVDTTFSARDRDIVIAAINGELTVKRLCKAKEQLFLLPENSCYSPITIHPDMHFHIWGVVTHVIHLL